MVIDPKMARAALSRRVPSRLMRMAASLHASTGSHRIPGNAKAAQRLVLRMKRKPDMAHVSVHKTGSKMAFIQMRRHALGSATFNEDGDLYHTETIHYAARADILQRGQLIDRLDLGLGFTSHAIQRWAERGEGLDLKASDLDLLRALDKEASLLWDYARDLRYPMISPHSKGLWIGQHIRDVDAHENGFLAQTFLSEDKLSVNQQLYYHGLKEFDDPNDLVRIIEGEEGQVELLNDFVNKL